MKEGQLPHAPSWWVSRSRNQSTDARLAQLQAFRNAEIDRKLREFATEGLVVVHQEQPRGLRIPKAVLPLAAALELLALSACAREDEEPVVSPANPPSATATATARAGLLSPTATSRPAETPRRTSGSGDCQLPSQSEIPPNLVTMIRNLDETPNKQWQQFKSLNKPYVVAYPPGSTAESLKEIDSIRGRIKFNSQTGGYEYKSQAADGDYFEIAISATPVNTWVTLEDYAKNTLVQLSQYNTNSANLSEEIRKAEASKEEPWKMFGYSAVELCATRVDSQKTEILVLFKSNLRGGGTFQVVAVFLRHGEAWTVKYTSDAGYDTGYQLLQKMLASFKFLSK